MLSNFGINSNAQVVDKKLIPSISFDKRSGLFIIYFYVGKDFAQQSFSFDGSVFIRAWNNDFSLFFPIAYPNANKFVKDIFLFFSITPSLLRKVSHMNKKLKRKFKLVPKFSKIKKELGIPIHKSRSISSHSLDLEEIARCSHNMRLAVKLAASSFDLSFFEMWKSSYFDLLHANGNFNSIKFYSPSLFKKFSALVDKEQKKV